MDGPTPSRYEFTGITKDGRPIFIEVSATRTTYRNEPVMLSTRDVTERKLAEKGLLIREELEQLNRVKTRPLITFPRTQDAPGGHRR
jgi:hypothetical protein